MEKENTEENEKLKKLKERYGVIEEIPERELEETRPKFYRGEIREASLPELLLRIEKIEGKLVVLGDFKRGMDERLSTFSESIGELRSALLEKEKVLSKMEKDVQTVLDTVSGIEPEKIRKLFSKRDAEIEEIRAEIEKINAMVKEIQKQLKDFFEAMEKIKSIESLILASEKIDKKIEKIEEARLQITKTASKVESIFSELSEKAGQIEKQKNEIEKIRDLSVEIVKTLDELSLKLTKFVKKEELEELRKDIEKILGEKIPVKKKEEKPKEEKKEEDIWSSLREKWKRLASY
jgi:methyl-accepting chemotaxis protein